MKVFKCVVLVIFLVVASCYAKHDEEQPQASVSPNLTIENCSEMKGIDNSVACAAMSALNKLQDISEKDNIQILPGVVLTSDSPKIGKEFKTKRNMDIPENPDEKISKIFDMMLSIMNNFFSGRTLKIKMSEQTTNSVMRALEEGRGKMKKVGGPLIMALGAKLVAILLAGLAFLTSKAVIVSKIALVVAILIWLQSGYSSGGSGFFNRFGQGGWNNYNTGGYNGGGYNYVAYGAPNWQSGYNTATSQSYPYARSFESAQNLAYSAQKQ